jgi:probable HAF family extracellular repeat protein
MGWIQMIFDAYAVSADGSVVAGFTLGGETGDQAFRWTQAGGMVGLDYHGGAVEDSYAFGVSSDGAVVVGSFRGGDAATEEAFRWTQADGMVGLGHLPGATVLRSQATAVSGDGLVVVGFGYSA